MRGGGRVRLSVAESIGCGIDSRADDKDTVIQVANSLCICTLLDYASKISNERIIRFSCLVSPTSEALVNKTSQCYCSSVRSAASWLCFWGAFSILWRSSCCMACSAAYSSSASRNSSASRASISLSVSVLGFRSLSRSGAYPTISRTASEILYVSFILQISRRAHPWGIHQRASTGRTNLIQGGGKDTWGLWRGGDRAGTLADCCGTDAITFCLTGSGP